MFLYLNERGHHNHYLCIYFVSHLIKMSLLVNGQFPPVNPITSNNVTTDERATAIDFVNRVNYLFEEFNHEKMLDAFLPDSMLYHFHGVIKGRDGTRRFLEEQYGYLIPGVSRHATNHIVDRDGEDGVAVRYHQHLVRYAWPEDVEKVMGSDVTNSNDGLPGTWLFTPMMDRLKMTSEGWKIAERHLGPSVFNARFDPPR
jgi:hypothetical protein